MRLYTIRAYAKIDVKRQRYNILQVYLQFYADKLQIKSFQLFSSLICQPAYINDKLFIAYFAYFLHVPDSLFL